MSLLTGLISFWKLDGNSLDAHGSNNGTDTAVSYPAGKLGSCADGNGSTSTAAGLTDYTLTTPAADVTSATGELLSLGTITWA